MRWIHHRRFWLALMMAGAMARDVVGQTFMYPARQSFLGAMSSLQCVGDLNGDGLKDLVTGGDSAGHIGILLGLPHGLFAPVVQHLVGDPVTSADIGDLNGDGVLDLVTAHRNQNRVSVLLGTGTGGFLPRTIHVVGARPQQVRLADMNGDNKLDIVVANDLSDSVGVLLGDGAGGFGAHASVWAGWGPIGLAIGDLNGDGKLDVVASAYASSIDFAILLGNGLGGFMPVTTLVTALPTNHTVQLADINLDGTLDLVSSGNGGATQVLMGNGLGGFGALQPYTTVTDNALVDLNGDGRLDVIGCTNGRMFVAFGTATGTTISPASYSTGYQSRVQSVSDWDGDGVLDVLVTHASSGVITLLHGLGAGTFETGTEILPADSINEAVWLDANLDGQVDVVYCNYSGSQVTVRFGDGLGGFPIAQQIPSTSCRFITAGDFDADGWMDIAYRNIVDGSVGVCHGTNSGLFIAQSPIPSLSNGPVAAGDLNGDGRADLILVDYSSSLTTLLSSSTGGFAPGVTTTTPILPARLTVGYIDADPFADVVLSYVNSSAGAYCVMRGDGQGGFTPSTPFASAGFWAIAGLGDLNSDGHADLVTRSSSLEVRFGDGTGAFSAPHAIDSSSFLPGQRIHIADVNGDGRNDIAFGAELSPSCVVLLGDGQGSFSRAAGFLLGTVGVDFAFADVNSDGRMDAVSSGGGISILPGMPIAPTQTSAMCFGDGTGAACPCGLTSSTSAGCPNSMFGAGSVLTSSGNASLSNDTLTLMASAIPAGSAMFLQSLGLSGSGSGVPFGDGLLCLGGGIIRLGVSGVAANTARSPAGPAQRPLHLDGNVTSIGTRFYQAWYRDSNPSFCTPSTHNFSPALAVLWTL